jgi:putative membrane protein
MKTLKNLRKLVIAAGCAFLVLPAAAQSNPKLSDEEVAYVAVTANQIDIDNGRLAKEKSRNAEIRQFAETMINDHKAVIDQASALVKKLGVTPQENSVSTQLLSDAQKTEKALRAKEGIAFDKAYMDHEVAYHQAVISAVRSLLIPETENQELKALLQAILPALEAHLEHAKMVQQHLAVK